MGGMGGGYSGHRPGAIQPSEHATVDPTSADYIPTKGAYRRTSRNRAGGLPGYVLLAMSLEPSWTPRACVGACAALALLPRFAAAAEPPSPSAPPTLPGSSQAAVGGMRLVDAVNLALTRNERARISDLNVLVAEAGVERARAGFLPVITALGTDQQHAYASTDKTPNNIGNASLTLNQPIINAPAFALYGQAKRLADAQYAQNVDDKRLLAFSAANAFFAVLNAQDVLQAAQHLLATAKANLDDAQARAKAGLTSSNDVTRAQIDMASSAREAQTDQGTVDTAVVQLGFVINAPVVAPLSPPDATLAAAQQPTGQVDQLVRFAFDHRPDVVASRFAALAAHDFAEEPLLRLVPTLGMQGQATATTNSGATGRWNDELIQATLTWTLYDAGVRYADKHSRDAQAEIADLTVQQLFRSVDAQVRSAVALLAASQGAFHVADEAVRAARQSVSETEILYKQGLAKAIELVDANDSRFLAEVNYASAEFAVAQAYLGLRQALGLDALGTQLK
jgi:outer membrane protein